MKKNNVVFISSTGGHYSQLLQIINKYSEASYIITEKSLGISNSSSKNKYLFLYQQDRKNILFPVVFILNVLKSLKYILKYRPKVTITTGAGVVIPFCIFAKLFGGKLIYIESFAKIHSPTLTGKILYKFSDKHYVQWEEMKEHYPKGIFKGALY